MTHVRSGVVLAVLGLTLGVSAQSDQKPAVAYPEGYRDWVHVKSSVVSPAHANYATNGGWGFQRFVKDSKTELAASPTPQQCFACHDKLKKDGLILSSYRQ